MAKYQFGDNEIDLRDYIHNLENNYSSYVESRKDWSEGQKQEFRASYEKYLQGLRDQLQNDTNRFRTDSAGTIYDSTGELNNTDNDDIDPTGSEYYYDDKGNRITTDDYNLLKKRKQKKFETFSANREVATYLQRIGQAIRDKLGSTTTNSDAFNLKEHGFIADWNRANNPAGGKVDLAPYLEKDPLDEATGQRGTANRAAYLKEQLENYIKNIGEYDFSDTPFKDRDTYISRLRAAAQNLENGYSSEDTIALNQAGIGSEFLNNFFATSAKEQPKTEAEQAALDLAQMEKEKREQELIDERDRQVYENARSEFFSKVEPFEEQKPVNPLALSYNRQEMEKRAFEKFNNNSTDQQSVIEAIRNYINLPELASLIRGKYRKKLEDSTDITLQHIANNLDWAAQADLFKDSRYLTSEGKSILPDGYYVLPDSEDYEKWTYIAYNPITRQYQERSMLLNEELMERMAYPEYDRRKKAQKHQLGGTLKDLQARQAKAQEAAQKEAEIQQEAKDSGKSVESIKTGQKKPMEEGFSGVDKARMATAAADALAAVAAFVPGYGTVASGALGLGSTLTNIGVDIADKSMSGWDVAKNAAYGLGMDVVGLIPGWGAFGKGAKVAKILKPAAKAIMSSMLVYGAFDSAKAFNKLMSDPSSMDVNDWKNLATGLQALSGGARYVGGKKAMNRHTTSKDVADVKTSTGATATISKEQLDNLRATKGFDSQNALFKSMTKGKELQREFKNREIHWLKPWKSRLFKEGPEVTKRTEGSFLPEDNSLDLRFLRWVHGGPSAATTKPKTTSTTQKKQETKSVAERVKAKQKKQATAQTAKKTSKNTKRVKKRQEGGTLDLNKVRKFAGGSVLEDTDKLVRSILKTDLYSPAGVSGVGKKDTYTFDPTLRLDAALNRINDGRMTVDDVNQFQRRHSIMNFNWKGEPIKGEDVKQYQTDYEALGFNDEIIAPTFASNYDVKSSNPTSGDSVTKKWVADGFFDQITADRKVLAAASDYEGREDQLKSDIAKAKAAGYDYYLDPETNYYMLRPLARTAASATPTTRSSADAEGNTGNSTVGETKVAPQKADTKKAPSGVSMKDMLSKLFSNPTITYGLPRAIYADRMNRKITDLAKASVVPLLKDPFEFHRYRRSDLDAEVQGERSYADLRRLASRPFTSDGSLQAATQLQAEVQGQAARTAGKEKSNQVQRQYDELAWQQEKENAANRHENAMVNRAQLWNADKTKSAFDQAYWSKKFTNWDVFGQQSEFDARTKIQERKALTDNFARSDIHNAVKLSPNDYGANLNSDELAVWNKYVAGVAPSSMSPKELNSLRLANQKISTAETGQLRKYYNIPNTPWSRGAKPATTPWSPTVSKAIVAKNGAKLALAGIQARTADAERFQKQIKECIDRNEKAIDRLSKSLYGIIKASMLK